MLAWKKLFLVYLLSLSKVSLLKYFLVFQC